MDCSLPGSSVHGILQAIVLEWIAISFSKLILYFENSLNAENAVINNPFLQRRSGDRGRKKQIGQAKQTNKQTNLSSVLQQQANQSFMEPTGRETNHALF